MKTIKCPTCGKEHGLFWLVSAKDKRELMYRCDKVVRNSIDPKDRRYNRTVSTTANIHAPAGTVDDPSLPEEWTAAYKKKVQGELQTQLILMNK